MKTKTKLLAAAAAVVLLTTVPSGAFIQSTYEGGTKKFFKDSIRGLQETMAALSIPITLDWEGKGWDNAKLDEIENRKARWSQKSHRTLAELDVNSKPFMIHKVDLAGQGLAADIGEATGEPDKSASGDAPESIGEIAEGGTEASPDSGLSEILADVSGSASGGSSSDGLSGPTQIAGVDGSTGGSLVDATGGGGALTNPNGGEEFDPILEGVLENAIPDASGEPVILVETDVSIGSDFVDGITGDDGSAGEGAGTDGSTDGEDVVADGGSVIDIDPLNPEPINLEDSNGNPDLSEVPVPAGLPLLLTAIIGLGAISRRRQRMA
jgi:hypothetical protein